MSNVSNPGSWVVRTPCLFVSQADWQQRAPCLAVHKGMVSCKSIAALEP
jgi:hypothetical protein